MAWGFASLVLYCFYCPTFFRASHRHQAPLSATHPPMLMAVGPPPGERMEAPRAVASSAAAANGVALSAASAPASVAPVPSAAAVPSLITPASTSAPSSTSLHAAAAAATTMPPVDLPELSEESAEYDEEEGDYDLESDPESDDAAPPKPLPPGHKQP